LTGTTEGNGEPCEKCGNTTDFSYPIYSWHEYAIKCNKCGEEYG